MKIYNRKELKFYRRELRRSQTPPEDILWKELRGKKFLGYKFFRKYSVDRYILDFYCPKSRLAVELDGSHHAEKDVEEYDNIRTINLECYSIKVIRFWNSEVKYNLNSVLQTIVLNLNKE